MKPQLPEGYTVKYKHVRMIEQPQPGKLDSHPRLSAKGGFTEAKVFGAEGNLVAKGHAHCHVNDNFNKRLGRNIALGRALKDLRAGVAQR